MITMGKESRVTKHLTKCQLVLLLYNKDYGIDWANPYLVFMFGADTH